jgi:L-amino acid N-acyltransferase YncA
MIASLLAAGARATLDPPIDAYSCKPYRNYRALPRKKQNDVLRAEVHASLDADGGFAVVSAPDAPKAAAIVRPLPWDSGFFGLKMAKLSHVLRTDEAPRADVQSVIDVALRQCRERGIQHVAVRIDAADADTIQALEDAGFRMVDALVTYIYHHKREPPPPIKEMGVLRLFRPEDTEQIIAITREAYRGFQGRYHLDPHLDKTRADEIYIEWARKCCAFEWAEVVMVNENGKGELHGWASYRHIEPVSKVGGLPIQGGGLGACRRETPGAYAGIVRFAAVMIHGGGGVTECQTQLFNFPTIRVYEAIGTQFVRADYTLHAWLGE